MRAIYEEKGYRLLLRRYGNIAVFKKKLREGYTEVAVGDGNLELRGLCLCVFFNPNGNISTYEHPRFFDSPGHITFEQPYEKQYSQKRFKEHLKKFQIELSEKQSLAQIVKNWKK